MVMQGGHAALHLGLAAPPLGTTLSTDGQAGRQAGGGGRGVGARSRRREERRHAPAGGLRMEGHPLAADQVGPQTMVGHFQWGLLLLEPFARPLWLLGLVGAPGGSGWVACPATVQQQQHQQHGASRTETRGGGSSAWAHLDSSCHDPSCRSVGPRWCRCASCPISSSLPGRRSCWRTPPPGPRHRLPSAAAAPPPGQQSVLPAAAWCCQSSIACPSKG